MSTYPVGEQALQVVSIIKAIFSRLDLGFDSPSPHVCSKTCTVVRSL